MKNFLSLDTKKSILSLALIVLIILVLVAGLPDKLFKSLFEPTASSPKLEGSRATVTN